ncbi:MAG TPA: LamG-like jellyroll fold domain-containing protein [Verrucomicrobiae bacterium]|nr:LamG-like jellyroll fold domain-containing protein [Verrucomicrobiae bacterium]
MNISQIKNRILAFLALASILISGRTYAAQIQGVTIYAVSAQYSSLNGNPDRRPAVDLVNNNGLFGDMLTIDPQGSQWLDVAAPPSTNFVTFDLGAVHEVDAMKVWNFNQATAANLVNCVKYAYISYSTDGVEFTTNFAGAQYFVQSPGAVGAIAQTISSNMGFSARYVRINIVSNYTATGITGTVGLGKVRFVDNSVPPTVQSASENYGSNQVTVYFSESVDPASATNLANYSITSIGASPTISSVVMGEFNDRVILHTSPLTNQNYSVVASGVYDLALTQPITNNSTAAVQPELILWLQANAGIVTDSTGVNVTNWLDQSSYGHNAVTATVNQYTAAPTLSPGAINGLPVINFNGTELLKVPNDPNLAINGDVTICVVLDTAVSAAGDPISKTGGLSNTVTNNLPAPFDYQFTAALKSSMTWGNGSGGAGLGVFASTGAFVTGQYYIVTASVTQGTNFAWYLNGGLNGATVFPMGPVDSGTPIMLGVRSDSGNGTDKGLQFSGNMAEVMILRGNVTGADLLAVNNYLGAKYNITITHLGITEEPGNATATNGQTATFWVNAVGIPPISYQWKSNGVAIAGATSSVYTTPKLTLAADNASYTVTATTPVGATNSSAAILTVVPATLPPAVFSAGISATNATNIVVVYSEAVSNTSALNPANYSLNGVAPVSVVAGSLSNQVILTSAAALTTNTTYFLTIQNVQDLFANTIVTTNVLVLPAGMSLWLRADSGVVTDINGNIVQWLDQTANANNAVQYAGGPLARPTPQPGQLNGEPELSFNAANTNYLQAPSTASLAITGDMSIYVVGTVSSQSAGQEFIGKTAGSTGNIPAPYDYYVWNAANYTALLRGNGTGHAIVTAALPSIGVPHVFAVTMAGTSVTHYLDGNAAASGTLNTNTTDGGNPLYIGARQDFVNVLNGSMAEIMLFSNALSAIDRTNIDNYLGAKYFQLNITQQPQNISTNEGVPVTFSVAGNQGSAHLIYQWREATVNDPTPTNILNATNASYTSGILSPDDNGDSFDVLVSAPGSSPIASSPATVTVSDVAPVVASAGTAIWNPTEIFVVFSEAVLPSTATDINNYSLSPGGTILSAVMGDAPNKVILTTSPLNSGTTYSLTVSNVMDLFTNTIVSASTSIGVYPASTALWIEADAGVTVDSGTNTVNTWNDLSGNGNNLSQSSGTTYEPLLITNAINGWPVIRFTATNETYMSAGSSPSLAITGDLSIFAVVNFNGLVGSTNGDIVSKAMNNEPAPFDYYSRNTAVALYRGNGTVNGSVNGITVPSAGVPHVMDVVMQGTTVNHRLDGDFNGTGTISTTIVDQGTPLTIGTRDDGINRLNGDIAELIVIGSAADSNDVATLELYLGTKYGLAIAPMITQQPVAATNVDQDGTLTVPLGVAGASPLAFQWYGTNNVAVPGQTNSALIISNIASGGSYYLNASNSFGSTNSSTVVVTVVSGLTVNPLLPASLTTFEGAIETYTVSAVGTLPFSYQWFEDGVAIDDATNASYTLITQLDSNSYTCTVSNSYNGGTSQSSSDATLIGLAPSTNLYTQTVLSNNPLAYWRLNETNGPTVAVDQSGNGHNAAYTNVLLGVPGFNPLLEPDTAAQFGLLDASNSYAGEIDNSGDGVANIDFSKAAGGNAEFSVEAWAKTTNSAVQTLGAGLVAKGYGNGGEQFDLDVYNGFRFFVRDASGGVHGPTSTVVPAADQWYHVVGVCDESNGAVRLYVNGADVADSTGIASGLGVLSTTGDVVGLPGALLVSIGSRTSASTSPSFNLQFMGVMDEVALYNYALTPSQVHQDYEIGNLVFQPSLIIANAASGNVQLSWNAGILQGATNLSGPFNTLTNAVSPYTIPTSNTQEFYRVINN